MNLDTEEGLSVHGNTRVENIFIRRRAAAAGVARDTDFWFVNFDWAGHDGVAIYPVTLQFDEQLTALRQHSHNDWPEGVSPCGTISQALDRDILELSLCCEAAHAREAV